MKTVMMTLVMLMSAKAFALEAELVEQNFSPKGGVVKYKHGFFNSSGRESDSKFLMRSYCGSDYTILYKNLKRDFNGRVTNLGDEKDPINVLNKSSYFYVTFSCAESKTEKQ